MIIDGRMQMDFMFGNMFEYKVDKYKKATTRKVVALNRREGLGKARSFIFYSYGPCVPDVLFASVPVLFGELPTWPSNRLVYPCFLFVA